MEEPKTDEDIKEKNPKDTKLYFAIGIIALVFIALFAIKFIRGPTAQVITIDELHQKNLKGEESDINYVYNGFSFVFINGMWYTQVQKEDTVWDVPLHFGPKELENITIFGKLDSDFGDNDLYITFDPLGSNLQYVALSSAELTLSLTKGFGISPIAACDKNETEACINRPIKTCKDEDNIIYIKQANKTRVELRGNCVLIEGKGWEIVRATDRLLLKWYKIIN